MQVQQELGVQDAIAFDLTAACSGFVLGLITAAQFIHTGARKNILVIGADALSRYVDWNDRGSTCTNSESTLLYRGCRQAPDNTNPSNHAYIITCLRRRHHIFARHVPACFS